MSKFKIGDVVVRTENINSFKEVHPSDTVIVTGFTKDGYILLNGEPEETGGWFEGRFELYVQPKNKVPDNMEIVGYQVMFFDTWCVVDKVRFATSKSLGYNTRIIYAFI